MRHRELSDSLLRMPFDKHDRPWALVALPGLIKRTLDNPTPASVHKLRTTIRRVETLLITSGAETDHKKLLKQVARIRKSAGQVRDVDVHLGIVQGLDKRGVASDYSELKSHLKERRSKREKKLARLLEKQIEKDVVKHLKQVETGKAVTLVGSVQLGELATQFVAKGTFAPSEANLHGFRLDCKHLRYSAELAPESRERDLLISELKKVQDAIGAWHDVLTLRATAEELLGTTRPIISLLRTQAQGRFNDAERRVAKSLAVVRKTFTTSVDRKPVQAQILEFQGNAATA